MKISMIINVFLCFAALAFPFSVAATNIALGVVLALGILSGQWWRGAVDSWQQSRNLMLLFCLYFVLMIVSLLWSLDVSWGVHVIQRQWFWLLLPLIVFLLRDETWRRNFLFSLSAGLTLNLLFCVLQMFGYVVVHTDGSGIDDATGHIGHIGFGLVYGIWAAWLLYLGWQWQGRWRWTAWLLAGWSYVMIFSAQGRGGYIVALALMMLVIFQRFKGEHPWRPIVALLGVSLTVTMIFTVGPGKERWLQLWGVLTNIEYSQFESANHRTQKSSTGQRLVMLKNSIEVWQAYPWLGAGTGGVPTAVSLLHHQDPETAIQRFSHPHNQYLFNLSRWGVGGLALFIVLIYCWLRLGWQEAWNRSYVYPLVAISGGGLMIHAMFAPAMEEHFSGVLIVLLLGAGIASLSDKSSS